MGQKKLEADVEARRKEQGQLHKELLTLEKSLKKKETEMDKQVRVHPLLPPPLVPPSPFTDPLPYPSPCAHCRTPHPPPQRPIKSAVKERLELSKKKLATATTSEGSLKQETDRQGADVRDIEIQLADIAKSERMLEGALESGGGPAHTIVLRLD